MAILAPTPAGLAGRDLLSVDQLDRDQLIELLDLADHLKLLQGRGVPHRLLPSRTLAMIFQKPSTRTRVSFEVGIGQLGGSAVVLSASEMQLGRGESIEDTGIVLSRYVDAIMIRAGAHAEVEALAAAASVPVINGLTDLHHPCQALADVQTLRERLGDLDGRALAWVGDGCNNVCHSLITAAGMLGMEVRVATPLGFEPDPAVVATAGAVTITDDPLEAVAGADAVATDVWTSMGHEAERDQRVSNLTPYQVNRALLASAAPGHIVLHCLPAHYGEEITHEVLHGPGSAAWDEAENRLHAQKALMALVMA
ncbi:MAG TPA: ornithine carbamoyltransferase [Gaiellales bacterium]|nr:ornithine carbamoyltransferase [Gaiellales bacterium]